MIFTSVIALQTKIQTKRGVVMKTALGLFANSHLLVCALLFVAQNSSAQYVPTMEFGEPVLRSRSEIEANNVRVSLYNFGFSGRTGAGQGLPYEWPNGTGRHYLALVGMFIGGEIRSANGDTIQIVSVPAFRNNPINGDDWNFNPVPGYLNSSSNKIARSNDPTTWPPFWPDKMIDSTDPGWPGQWNGLLGKNLFIDGTEFYYHHSDSRYSRHPFFPDSTNLQRRGLGIVVSERVLEWLDPLLEDAIITVSDIYNVGTRDILKTALTLWVADFVGGDGDSQDDKAYYNLPLRTVYFTDADGYSINPAFAGVRVGVAALALIQTPEDSGGTPLGITSMSIQAAGSINFNLTPDDFFWDSLMVPGQFYDPNIIPVGENDVFASCGFFPLPARTSKRLVSTIVLAQDTIDAARKIRYVKGFVNGGYSTVSSTVSILSPISGQIVSGQVPIQWNAENNDPALSIDIIFSSNDGDTWSVAAEQEANDGSYLWNTDTLADGIFYRLRIAAYDSTHLGYRTMDSSFTLNNPQPSAPQVRIRDPLEGQVVQSPVQVRWVGGDPDGDTTSLNLHYFSLETNSWTPIASGLPGSGEYAWDTFSLPNSPMYRLSADISDGASTGRDTVLFEIRNPRHILHDTAFVQRSTIGTGLIQVRIVDSNQVNGHTYRVEFSGYPSAVTTYDVIDENTSLTVVDDATQVDGILEGTLFDGIRLFIHQDSLTLNQAGSYWNRAGIYEFVFGLFRGGFTVGTPEAADYDLTVGSIGIDTSTAIVVNSLFIPSRAVNITLHNMLSGQRVPFAFFERDGNDGRFTTGSTNFSSDIVIFLTRNSQDSLVPSWALSLQPQVGLENPQPGDSLTVNLFKRFANGDFYRFTAISGGLLHVSEIVPIVFSLGQNFPNPFNPSTQIKISIGLTSHVNLEIYDILGRKVRSLVNEQKQAGEYVIAWDGRNDHGNTVVSGVYFYRIAAGSFVSVRKMLVLK